MLRANVADPVPVKWYYRPAWVLLLLFVVLGPLGLPYLWKSPCFSRPMKIALTVVELVVVMWLVGEVVQIFHAVQEELGTLDATDRF